MTASESSRQRRVRAFASRVGPIAAVACCALCLPGCPTRPPVALDGPRGGGSDAAATDVDATDAAAMDAPPDAPLSELPGPDLAPFCGDGVKNGLEQCDGKDLGGKTCAALGFAGGVPSCTKTCLLTGCSSKGFVSLKAATFVMGSPQSEACRFMHEDQHQVTLTRPFELAATETTQAAFFVLMGYNPSLFGPNSTNPKYMGLCTSPSCPLENVTWSEAAAYCNALSAQRGFDACYSCTGGGASVDCKEAKSYQGAGIYACPGYRLPTDAEWEYAYRAGTTTPYYSGANDPTRCTDCSAKDVNADAIGWYCANAGGRTHPVGQKQPNAWGLYDMAGNVYDWCHDWYQKVSLGTSPVTDPWGAPSGIWRVMRGGTYSYICSQLRAADRGYTTHNTRNPTVGFRCCRTTKP